MMSPELVWPQDKEAFWIDLQPALFTSEEMHEWNAKLHFPDAKEAITNALTQGICSADSPLAEASCVQYSLARIEKPVEEAAMV